MRHSIDPDNPPTNIVLSDDKVLVRSDAAIEVLSDLPGYRWARSMRLVPKFLRDWLYDRIALNRYRLFGRRNTCMVLRPEFQNRFIERVQDLPL